MFAETILFSLRSDESVLRGNFNAIDNSRGIVLLSSALPAADADLPLVECFNAAGLSTFSVGLLSDIEENSPDARDNVPLLSKRLFDFFDHLKRHLAQKRLPLQPVMLYAAGAASPAALRVAARRDNEIVSIVCRDGLIDRAGTLYLNSLNAPLLLLVSGNDALPLAAGKRAIQKIRCKTELAALDALSPDAPNLIARKASAWFLAHLVSSD